MSTRDELTKTIAYWLPTTGQDPDTWAIDRAGQVSNELWARGWRKMPSEAEVIAVLDDDMNWDVGELSPVLLMEETARAILALMDKTDD